ncbi:MAG: cell wall-binding repeat-containing protein [Euzebya sp.]
MAAVTTWGHAGKAVAIITVLVVSGTFTTQGTTHDRVTPLARMGPAGEPGEGLWAARESASDPQVYSAALSQAASVATSPLASLHPWQERGPRNIGGRLTDLALAPDGTVYAAAASGGLWASTDEGATLQPAWPPDLTPAIGAVAVTAEGIVLVGTGEANGGGGSLTYGGNGVYRSTDEGATWTHVGLANSGAVARIEPHPVNPDVVFLAAGGDLFAGGGQRGIFRSLDAGRSWRLILGPATPTAGGADLAIDPADPDHLLAAMWDRTRTPGQRLYGGPGSGLYSSRDSGDTWQPVGGELPGFAADSGRIAVAFSPADPARVYAVVTRGDGRAGGLWRSDDGGVNWTRVDDSPIYAPTQFIFAWWYGKVFPAPDDPDRVLVPGLALLESTDGGVTFSTDAAVHADHHDLLWDPEDPQRAYLATDGGMYVSDQGGRSLTWRATDNQPFTQLYSVATSVLETGAAAAEGSPPPAALVGGFQDVGCLLTRGAPQEWGPSSNCGDGTRVLTHPDRTQEVILCGQYGRCQISDNFGNSTRLLRTPSTRRQAWHAPLIRLPDQPDSLLYAGETVHRSDDDGSTWQQVSPDLTRGSSPDPDYPFGTITTLAAMALQTGDTEADRSLAVGTDDGLVWRSDDNGVTWDRLVDGQRWVTSLTFVRDGRLLIGTSGYRSGDDAPQVLVADGPNVTTIGEGLPQAPVNDLVLVDDEPGSATLVAATDVGVFVAFDLVTPVWRRVGSDLPQAPVMDLDWRPSTRQLTIATYGRGAWTIPLPALTRHAGPERYATAAAISTTVPTALADQTSGTTVVLASGEDFPDALTAAAMVAADPSARLVLTRPEALPSTSQIQIEALSPTTLLVVGGPTAVSQTAVDQAVQSSGGRPSVTRVQGSSRYGTAAAIAGSGTVSTVVLATAGSPFDALAGASYAASLGAPILLVDPQRVPLETAEALSGLDPSTIVALGGETAISTQTLVEAAAISGATTQRLAGSTRIDTAIAIMQAAGPDDELWLVTARDFPDSLAAAATGAAVLLTPPEGLTPELEQAISSRAPLRLRVAGGSAVIDDQILTGLRLGPG